MFKGAMHLNGIAAILAIFHVNLLIYRCVQKHGDLHPAIGALKEMFDHNRSRIRTAR